VVLEYTTSKHLSASAIHCQGFQVVELGDITVNNIIEPKSSLSPESQVLNVYGGIDSGGEFGSMDDTPEVYVNYGFGSRVCGAMLTREYLTLLCSSVPEYLSAGNGYDCLLTQ
jgi:hypothetical protein